MDRPTGITVLGVLYVLAGIAWIAMAFMMGALSSSFLGNSMMGGMAAIGGMVTGIAVIVAAIEFVIAGALFSGKSWGRTIVIVLVIIDLIIQVMSIFGMNVFGIAFIILDLVVLYYMWRPHVIEYFKGTSGYKTCIYCNYMAKDSRDLHNHQLDCQKKKEYDSKEDRKT